MVRMVLVRSMVMTGLAFSIGLLVGLCLHLPGVSSPETGGAGGGDHLLRTARRAREALGSARRIQSAGNVSGVAEEAPNRAPAPPPASHGAGPSWVGQHKLWLQEKMKAIEATYASIAEVKRRSGGGQVLGLEPQGGPDTNTHQRHADSKLPSNSPHKDSQRSPNSQSHPQKLLSDPQQEGRVPPPGDQRRRLNLKPDPLNPPAGEGSPDTPVSGSRTVTVMVTGGQQDYPPLEEGERRDPSISKNKAGDSSSGNTGRHSVGHNGDVNNGRRNVMDVRHGDITGTSLRHQEEISFRSLEEVVTGGIYWSPQVELLVPPGFSDDQVSSWRRTVAQLRVVRMEEGCGRMQNRRLTLEDGRQACARYRVNTDQMQGEVYSYYLARLLGIKNLAPVVLTAVDPATDSRWGAVDAAAARAQWSPEKPLVLTPFMDHLHPAYIPRELRTPGKRDSTGSIDVRNNLHPSHQLLVNHSVEQLSELVQWSDLLILDFLTANVDRVVNNLFNLQWNTEMMNSPAHNLEVRSQDGLLVFLDNESGLFHSYRLLDKYAHYHDNLLGALCVFRKGTAQALKKLHEQKNAGEQIMEVYRQEEPRHWMLPPMPESNRKVLQERIGKVVDQINRCESRYSNKEFS